MPSSKRRIAALVILAVLAFSIPLFVAELGARLFLPQAESLFNDPALRERTMSFVTRHPTRGFALTPGFENDEYRINGAGFRGGELPEDLDRRFVIAALGESTTYGYGVKNGASYPALLQRELDALPTDPPIYVLNAGVPSYTSSQVLIYLRELIEALEPDLAIVNIQWNDIWFSVLRPWYPELLVFQQPSPWRAFLMRYSAVYRALMARRSPGAADILNTEALVFYRANLEAMAELCAERGIPLVFMHAPFDPEHMGDEGFDVLGTFVSRPFFFEVARAFADVIDGVGAERGVPVVHHSLGFEGTGKVKLFVDLLHANRRGNLILAGTTAQFLRDRRLLPPER